MIDDMASRGRDDGGEWVEDYTTTVTEEARVQLTGLLQAWARTHCQPDFYKVRNTRPTY